jgi:hypothetical protein
LRHDAALLELGFLSSSEANFLAQQLSNASPALPRRRVLRAVLSGVSAVLWISRTMAQQKMSPVEAEYQDQPKSGLACAACTLFRPPRSCQVVQGDISPNGWCKFFDLPD